MELLGLNPVLLLAQLISFGVLFFVLKKFLFSSIKKALDDRTEKIRQIQENNLIFDKKIQEFEEEKVKMKNKNQDELRKLLAESKKDAEILKREILEQAETRSKKILEETTKQIEQEKEKASESLKKEAGLLATALATKIMSTPKNTVKVMNASISELERAVGKKK